MRTGKLLDGAVVVAAVVVAAVVVAAVVVVVMTGVVVLVVEPMPVVPVEVVGRVVVVWTDEPVVDQAVVVVLMTDVGKTVEGAVVAEESEPDADVSVVAVDEGSTVVTCVLPVSEGRRIEVALPVLVGSAEDVEV